jgi:hypothetical protein
VALKSREDFTAQGSNEDERDNGILTAELIHLIDLLQVMVRT